MKPVQSCATRCSNNVELKIVCRRHVTRIDFLCKKYCIKNCHFAVLHVPLVLSGGFSHTRAARIIYGLTWDTPSQTIQESVKWKPLKPFYHLNLLSIVFKSYYDLSPLSLRKLFDKRERTYNFRKTNCLRLPRLDLMKKSISYQGAVLWNSLSNDDRASK